MTAFNQATENNKYRKIRVVIGACLAMSTIGFPWYWGNLSIYTTSYRLATQPNVETEEILTPWPLPLWVTSTCVVIFFAGELARVIGARPAALCGIILQNAGLACGYLVLEKSTFLFTVCVGVLPGLGGGGVTVLMMQVVVGWAEDQAGLYIAIIRSVMVLGAVVINQFVTVYLNPGNKTPDVQVGSQTFFTDKGITDRVPVFFLILGGGLFIIQLVGLLLVRENDKNKNKSDKNMDIIIPTEQPVLVKYASIIEKLVEDNVLITTSAKGEERDQGCIRRNAGDGSKPDLSATSVRDGERRTESCNTSPSPKPDLIIACVQAGEQDLSCSIHTPTSPRSDPCAACVRIEDERDERCHCNANVNDSTSPPESDLSPTQILRTKQFYTLFVTMALASVPYVTVNTYYKSYAQVWIHDDYFLTILGNILIAVIVIITVVLGYLVDRFGVKRCLMLYLGSVPLACVLFYFSPLVNKWLFCASTLLFGGIASPIFLLFSTCTSKAFGITHFSRNYGLVMSSSVVLNLVTPIFLGAVLDYLGWLYLFLFAALFDIVAFVLVIVTLKE